MGMQGWRRTMEDSHIAHTDLDNGVSLFGVFDGHGGKSEFCIFFSLNWSRTHAVDLRRVVFSIAQLRGNKSMVSAWLQPHYSQDKSSLKIMFDIGQEVALWVKENFKKELVKLQSYKSKCYKESLEECFHKLDELMETPAG